MPRTIFKNPPKLLKFLFDEKFMQYSGHLKKINAQLYVYLKRIYAYLENMNIMKEEIQERKMNLIFSCENETIDEKFMYVKKLLSNTNKMNSMNSMKVWYDYYKWCIFYEKYEEAEKIIKLLNSKNKSEDLTKEICIKIKISSISHYIYFLLLGNKKYNLEEFNFLIETNLQFVMNELGFGCMESESLLTSSNLQEKRVSIIEDILKNPQKLSRNMSHFLLILLMCTSIFTPHAQPTHSFIMSKFKLVSKYTNVVECISVSPCKHVIKQEISIFMIRIFMLIKQFNNEISSPKNYCDLLIHLNNFNMNENDIFIVLLIAEISFFSNPIDRDMKFFKHFGENMSLKHLYYFYNIRVDMLEFSAALNSFKIYWNLYNQNLIRISYIFDEFEQNKKLIEEKSYACSINNKYNDCKILKFFINDLLNKINCELFMRPNTTLGPVCGNILHYFLDYSLFLAHEYSYSKCLFLKKFKNCQLLLQKTSNENNRDNIHKHIIHLFDIIKIKEIRFYNDNFENILHNIK